MPTETKNGLRFARREVVRMIAISCGISPAMADGRFKGYVAAGLILSRRTNRGTHWRYSAEDAATAIVLSALQDLGIQDHAILRTAAHRCANFAPGAQERDAAAHTWAELPTTPIGVALSAVHHVDYSESVIFRLDFWRNVLTEERIIDADIYLHDADLVGRVRDGSTLPLGMVAFRLEDLITGLLPPSRAAA